MIKRLIYCPDCRAFSTVDEENVHNQDDVYMKAGKELIKISSYVHCKKCNQLIPLEIDLADKFDIDN